MTEPADGSPAEPGREAGVLLHISSLPGRYGIGETGSSAFAFVDLMRQSGLGVWQFLPLGPTAYGDSPYQSLSTFAGNEMLIDVHELRKMGLLSRLETDALLRLPLAFVDYAQLIPLKWRLLLTAASRFFAVANSNMQADFDRYCETRDAAWLNDYALFRVLKAQHHQQPWPSWPRQYANRDRKALRQLGAEAAHLIQSIKVLQFLFYHQWQALRHYASEAGIRLFGDMPIYIALDSADAWANPEILRMDEHGIPDAVAGVPPDYFSNDGQLWGNPLYAWDVHKADSYRWWGQRMRGTLEFADLIRIDHFRGFESYWAVPAAALTAREGQWETGPGDALFNALEGELGRLPVVAEDLGLITPAVVALRDRHGLPGMTVLQFAINDDGFELRNVPENRVCYTGTHDNDTTLGWYRGSPDDARTHDDILATQHRVREVTGGDGSGVSMDLVRAAFATDARLAIAPMQDYLGLGSEARLNTPGTTNNNWRWRATAAQVSRELCDRIGAAVDDAGRTHAAAVSRQR